MVHISATLLDLSGPHLQSTHQCLAKLQGPEITFKVLLPAPKGLALLPSKLLCPPRGGWETEESLSGTVSQHCLALSSRSQKEDRSAFCSVSAPICMVWTTRQKPMTSVMQMLRLQEVPGYPGLACSFTKTLNAYTKYSPPTTGMILLIPPLTPESTAPFSLNYSGKGSLIFQD